VLLAACGGGRADRAAAPATSMRPNPLRVAVVGDSLMFDAAPAVEAALRSAGPVEVRSLAVLGFGLSHGPFDWRAEWPRFLDETSADAVVVMLGAWDIGAPDGEGEPPVPPGSPEWQAWYAGLLDEAIGVLRAGGARVWWMGMPPVADPALAPGVAGLNDAVRAAASRHRGVAFVDSAAVLAGPGGGFTPTLPGPGGAPVRVRKGDGVHFCPDGAARLGEAVAVPLLAAWGLAASPGWEQGPWRDEERYSWAPGGGCPPP
jgi:hypothetical protein